MTEGSHKDQSALNNPLAEMSFGQQITKSIEKQNENNAFFGLD